MEFVQELVPFVKDILRQKPSRAMVKIYLIGSMLAFAGVMIGVLNIAYQPFSVHEIVEEGSAKLEVAEKAMVRFKKIGRKAESAVHDDYELKQESFGRRNSTTRLHAS